MLNTLMLTAMSVCQWAGCAAADQGPLTIGSQHELFLDGRGVEVMENLTRRVVPGTKYAKNPVLVPDKPWEMQGFVGFPSVYYDPQRKMFRMWYLVFNAYWSRNTKAPDGSVPPQAAYYKDRKLPNTIGAIPMADSAFICYAESPDGETWTKPELGLVDFQGSNKNNIVLRHRGSHFDSFSVIWRPDHKKPEERYILVAFVGIWPYDAKEIAERGLKYDIGTGHYAFTSADGLRWTPRWDRPVASIAQSQDRATWSWDPHHERFIGNLKWYETNRRCRRQAESTDLFKWTVPRLVLYPDKADPPDAEFYGHYVFPYGSQYAGWLELYQPQAGTIDFQMISSRDGQTWDRVADRGVLVPRGEKGAFDSMMILIPGSPPIALGNDLWIYYEGSPLDHNAKAPARGSIGLAKTHADRFVAVQAGATPGKLVTRPLVLKGGRLFANVSVAKDGSIRVEATKPDGTALPGFEADKSLPVTGDSPTAPLSWRGDPALPTGEPLKLVFHLHAATLYAYWCQ